MNTKEHPILSAIVTVKYRGNEVENQVPKEVINGLSTFHFVNGEQKQLHFAHTSTHGKSDPP